MTARRSHRAAMRRSGPCRRGGLGMTADEDRPGLDRARQRRLVAAGPSSTRASPAGRPQARDAVPHHAAVVHDDVRHVAVVGHPAPLVSVSRSPCHRAVPNFWEPTMSSSGRSARGSPGRTPPGSPPLARPRADAVRRVHAAGQFRKARCRPAKTPYAARRRAPAPRPRPSGVGSLGNHR